MAKKIIILTIFGILLFTVGLFEPIKTIDHMINEIIITQFLPKPITNSVVILEANQDENRYSIAKVLNFLSTMKYRNIILNVDLSKPSKPIINESKLEIFRQNTDIKLSVGDLINELIIFPDEELKISIETNRNIYLSIKLYNETAKNLKGHNTWPSIQDITKFFYEHKNDEKTFNYLYIPLKEFYINSSGIGIDSYIPNIDGKARKVKAFEFFSTKDIALANGYKNEKFFRTYLVPNLHLISSLETKYGKIKNINLENKFFYSYLNIDLEKTNIQIPLSSENSLYIRNIPPIRVDMSIFLNIVNNLNYVEKTEKEIFEKLNIQNPYQNKSSSEKMKFLNTLENVITHSGIKDKVEILSKIKKLKEIYQQLSKIEEILENKTILIANKNSLEALYGSMAINTILNGQMILEINQIASIIIGISLIFLILYIPIVYKMNRITTLVYQTFLLIIVVCLKYLLLRYLGVITDNITYITFILVSIILHPRGNKK